MLYGFAFLRRISRLEYICNAEAKAEAETEADFMNCIVTHRTQTLRNDTVRMNNLRSYMINDSIMDFLEEPYTLMLCNVYKCEKLPSFIKMKCIVVRIE